MSLTIHEPNGAMKGTSPASHERRDYYQLGATDVGRRCSVRTFAGEALIPTASARSRARRTDPPAPDDAR